MNRRVLLVLAVAAALGFAAYTMLPQVKQPIDGFIATVMGGVESNPTAAGVMTLVGGSTVGAVSGQILRSVMSRGNKELSSTVESWEGKLSEKQAEYEGKISGLEGKLGSVQEELKASNVIDDKNAESIGKLTTQLTVSQETIGKQAELLLANNETIKKLTEMYEATKNALEARTSGADGRG